MSMNFREEMFRESAIQAMRSVSLTLNASFLLYGATATMLFTSHNRGPALWCCLATLLVVICMALTYATMLGIGESWRPGDTKPHSYKLLWLIEVDSNNHDNYRNVCILIWVLSIAPYLVGVYQAL